MKIPAMKVPAMKNQMDDSNNERQLYEAPRVDVLLFTVDSNFMSGGGNSTNGVKDDSDVFGDSLY